MVRRGVVALLVLLAFGVGLPAAAHEYGSISGTVTNEDGAPLGGVCVTADGESWGWGETAADGTYLLGRLEAGTYRVRFWDCASGEYLSEYYDDAPDYRSATLVTVLYEQDTSGIDAALARGGTITGTVTDAAGAPLEGICVSTGVVEVVPIPAPEASAASHGGWGTTGPDGRYRLGGLRTGEHRVHFADCTRSVYAPEWFDDAADHETATPVSVTAGQETAGVDASLAVGGVITGTVKDAEGRPLPGGCVSAEGASWNSGFTDGSGAYSVGGLAAGEYRVHFSDCQWPNRYESEYYDDARGWEAATLVRVALGESTGGIDAVLEPATDLSLSGLRVENVPLHTDHGPLVHSGLYRRVHVELSSDGRAVRGGDLMVRACPKGSGDCRSIAYRSVDVPPGGSIELVFDWRPVGVGDFDIVAELEAWDDPVLSNNRRSVSHHAVVGGTGFGVGW